MENTQNFGAPQAPTQQEEVPQKPLFPTEEVTLPSKGLLYAQDSTLSKGIIEMKYMTAKEEDLLTNTNYIKNGTVIDKLLQSLIVTPCNYNELLIGDKNAIMIAARILGYGADYEFKYNHPVSGVEEIVSVDLTTIEDKFIDDSLVEKGKNEFHFTLPASKKPVTFKLLTHGDDKKIESELKGLKKLHKGNVPEMTTRVKHTIISVDGDYEKKSIREFVDNELLARDARALRNHIREIQPDIDLKFDFEGEDGYIEENVSLPINANFFWPDASI
jgi:hypothetical protein